MSFGQTLLERIGIRETQFTRAARLANQIYNNLNLDGLSQDSKIIKLALFVDAMKHTGEEIELETVFKLVGGKMGIQLIKEKAKALKDNGIDGNVFKEIEMGMHD